jgi:hypothetical protein
MLNLTVLHDVATKRLNEQVSKPDVPIVVGLDYLSFTLESKKQNLKIGAE